MSNRAHQASQHGIEKENVVLPGKTLRPREKMMEQGASSLSEAELLAIILGRGVQGSPVETLARELAIFLRSLRQPPSLQELIAIRGLGSAKACQVLASLELSCRFLMGEGAAAPIVHPALLLPHLAFLKARNQEMVVCATLDTANCLLRIHVLTQGLLNCAPFHPREAFRQAISDSALSVIFAHNHPSGCLQASREDLEITRQMVRCGNLLEIPVLDHIIVSSRGWTSIRTEHPEIFRCGH